MQRALSIVAVLVLLTTPASAASPFRGPALVIGNTKYKRLTHLKKAQADAREIATRLALLGFYVTARENLDAAALKNEIESFAASIEDGTDAFFFYSGHGQTGGDGSPYLLPVDRDPSKPLVNDAFNLNDLILRAENYSARRVFVLDACRDVGKSSIDAGEAGLHNVTTRRSGTFVAYATSPGQYSLEGKRGDPFSAYTTSLARHIADDAGIERIFKRVRADVVEQYGDDQVPWDSSSLVEDFSLRGATVLRIKVPEPNVEVYLVVSDSLSEKQQLLGRTRTPDELISVAGLRPGVPFRLRGARGKESVETGVLTLESGIVTDFTVPRFLTGIDASSESSSAPSPLPP